MSTSDKPLDLFQQAQTLRERAQKLRVSNGASPAADRLDAIAQKLEDGGINNAISADLESHKTRNAQWLDQMKRHGDWYLENDKAVLNLSQAAVRTLVLVNAGAAIALLSFVANIWQKGTDVSPFVGGLAWFCLGVGAATLTAALSYFTQLLYGSRDDKELSLAKLLHKTTVVIGFASLIIFAVGCFESYKSFNAKPVQGVSQNDTFKKNYPPPVAPPPQPSAPAIPIPQTPQPAAPKK